MAVRPRIDFFFDVISPYSWIAFEAITRYSAVWPVDVNYKPFNFATIVKNNPGAPLKNDAKKWYLYHDIGRAAKYWNFEIRMPKDHEKIIFSKSPAPANRLLNAFLLECPSKLVPMARSLWKRFYFDDKGFFEDSDLLEAMHQLNVADPGEMLELSKSEKVRQMLRDHTSEAVAGRAFGAPWFHVHAEGREVQYFFGSDCLPLIADCLSLPYTGAIKI